MFCLFNEVERDGSSMDESWDMILDEMVEVGYLVRFWLDIQDKFVIVIG